MTGCPRVESAEPGIGRLFQLTRFADQGTLPVAGGALDQADAFLSAMQLIHHDKAHWGVT